MEWVEVRGKSVDVAVEAALQELGLSSREQAEVEVVQEPERGFLGIGGRDAVVRVRAKARGGSRPRRRRRGGGSGSKQAAGQEQRQERRQTGPRGTRDGSRQRSRDGRRKEGAKSVGSQNQEREQQAQDVDIDQQAAVIGEFLDGLLEAFGLEGQVATRVDDDVIYAEVTGEQTEALVGSKGEILQAIQELARTVVQRQTRSGARLRLDIAGYAERRREALRIYAQRLAQRVLDEGVEVMLEPMNPADRKVVHDAVLDTEGVRSYSEGEEPQRSVVISLAPGHEARAEVGGSQQEG
ncbi:MAG: Jag N-terminal domain-containing protein [Actinomycetota bacterium]|nr:Jag N-terminal domain-containing protein [Actinomycetota bacterium]